ncbi:hypothetical protein H6G76_03390 [Nostoc sp. FACHB-152]|uniref:hypothetical protein n=1 Tax=unclassified Nostoc TaxID=2593658 RepID=UPI0016880AA9|nr:MULTISPECIES: hypothetical protein [unclassified Nostoc]MBD2446215.1 hypothetical protein [Nostoc sp. FACHB-152]MBD2469485.1 hypothetical protein [Nostoc sp. FACHB-145]
MSKLISALLITTTLLLTASNNSNISLAGTCASNCGKAPIQFTPGQRIRIQVVNSTPRVLKIQKPSITEPVSLSPGQTLKLEQIEGTEPNTSLIFWDETGRSIQANLSKPNLATLRVELRPTARVPGDRSVYIQDDGRINVL